MHILLLSNSHNNVASIQKNRGDKSHDYTMPFISYDSIQTRCDSYLSLSNSPNYVASIQKNRGDKLHDYMMRFIGYDSIQTRWFISYLFQIHTIMEVTFQYPALKRFPLVSADTWYGSNTPTWIDYNASVLQSLTYLLIRAHFSEMGHGQFNMSPSNWRSKD